MLYMNMYGDVPPGFTLRSTLKGHTKAINRIAWSPDGQSLASPSNDGTIRIWDFQTGQLRETHEEGLIFSVVWSPDGYTVALGGASGIIILNTRTGERRVMPSSPTNSAAWSPDGQFLAFGSYKTVQILDLKTGRFLFSSLEHFDEVTSVAWSPDGQVLASGSTDCSIKFWDPRTGQLLHLLTGHSHMIRSMAWSPDGHVLASGSSDTTIRLWHWHTGRQMRILEGHTSAVICVSFSPGGYLLASKSHDGTVQCWRANTWEQVAVLKEPLSTGWSAGIAFHPRLPVLATLDEADRGIRVWNLDSETLLKRAANPLFVQYTNAKVIMVGDSGVGKSGLGLVLTGQDFEATDSTHGRHVWTFDSQEFDLGKGRKETRETLLWDLAGQPGYRLIHQLHLNEISVALVVFDARSETDPFTGVGYWVRALRQAQRVQGDTAPPLKIFLVAARVDRGGVSVSRDRIEALISKLGLDGYFETSAKEGRHIELLANEIRKSIVWDILPQVSSTDLFRRIKSFLIAEKEAGRFLSTEDDLYRNFLASHAVADSKDLRVQFTTCIGLVQARGLIRQLSYGNRILLQPERLDAYASALVNAVLDEPDGLGCIAQEKVIKGDFFIPREMRLENRQDEEFLLTAMIDDLLRQEVVLPEHIDNERQLIFPSQSTRENPDLLNTDEKEAVTFNFEGPVSHIYATLAVRLSRSDVFTKKEFWKNAITYTLKNGEGTYGLFLDNRGEGYGALSLFFSKTASEEMCFHFEAYVEAHLQRWALPQTIQRRRIFPCSYCQTLFTEEQVTRRREKGFNWIICGVCETRNSLHDKEYQSRVTKMDQEANLQRDIDRRDFLQDRPGKSGSMNIDLAAHHLRNKMERGDYDVFLCYTERDKSEVEKIALELKKHGVLPWLDVWERRPGLPWQVLLERQLPRIRSAAIFVGKESIGAWQNLEVQAFLFEFVNRNCPVIPVLLANAPRMPQLTIFLRNMTWVDFRTQNPNPMRQLIWGITGVRDFESDS